METQNQESTIFTAMFELDDMLIAYYETHSGRDQHNDAFNWILCAMREMARKEYEIHSERALKYAYIHRFLMAHTGKAQQRKVG